MPNTQKVKEFIMNTLKIEESEIDFSKIKDICAYIYWAEASSMQGLLTFEYPREIYQLCKAIGDSKLYKVSYGLPLLW